jgi:integrase
VAGFEKLKDGKWRANVARQGVRRSKTLPSKRAAQDWAAHQEHLILNAGEVLRVLPFSDVLERYANEVSPSKRGERWEILRLRRFKSSDLGRIAVADLVPQDFARWRDLRLKEVSPGTVNREMTLLSGVLTIARKEWGLIEKNPIADVRKPSKPPARDRIATEDELARLALSGGADLGNATARAFHAFLFAIETAMRAGEIVGLDWSRVNLADRFCSLPLTKNGTARDVPLSLRAVELLGDLQAVVGGVPAGPVFGLTSRQLDVLWRKLRDRAAVDDLTFHDSRHIAITRLAGKLEVLELARMVGHRNLNELLTYYNASAAQIAKRLD